MEQTDTSSPTSLPARKRTAMISLLCVILWLSALYIGVYGLTLLARVGRDDEPFAQIGWIIVLGTCSILFAITATGLWRARRWGVTLSALTFVAALLYSVVFDVRDGNILGVAVKVLIIIPTLVLGHLHLWRIFEKQ